MQQVVGAAIVRDGRVLAARRTRPVAAAGRWEFPGGKVEAGESPEAALVREIAEELGVTVAVIRLARRRGPDRRHPPGSSSRSPRSSTASPMPSEHDEIRWLAAPSSDDVDWLDPDRPFLPAAARDTGRVRGIFFDEDHARAVVARLVSDGYDAEPSSASAWPGRTTTRTTPGRCSATPRRSCSSSSSTTTTAGWTPAPRHRPAAPLDLPQAPKRIKRP